MDQDRVEVDQDPARVLVSVDRQRPHTMLARPLDDAVGDGLHLAVGLTLADDEVIGDGGLAFQGDPDRLLGELVLCRGLDQLGELQGAQLRLGQRFDYACWGA